MNNSNEGNIQNYLNDNFEQKVQNTVLYMLEQYRIAYANSSMEIANKHPSP